MAKQKTSEPPQPTDEALVPVEIIKRGFFQIVVQGDDVGKVVLDTTLLPQDIQTLMKEAAAAAVDAGDTEVDSLEMREYAATQRAQFRDSSKQLDNYRLSITRRIDVWKEAVMLPFRKPVADFDAARLKLDQKLVAYETAEAEKRKAAEAEARRLLEEERRKKEAEARRVEEEAKLKQEQLRRDAEAAAVAGNQEKVMEITKEAAQVRENAVQKIGTIAQESAMMEARPITAPPPPRVAGFGITSRWKCRVLDIIKFDQGVIDGKIPKVYSTYDQKGLDRQAALLKGDFDYPGCEAYEEKGGFSR